MRDGSECLCPTCLICKSKIPLLGSKVDVSVWLKQPHEPTRELIFNVGAARKAIYEDSYVVNSAAVNSLLKKYSYVPTEVCGTVWNTQCNIGWHIKMQECIPGSTRWYGLQLFQDICCGSTAWVWTGGLENVFYPFIANIVYTGNSYCARTGWMVYSYSKSSNILSLTWLVRFHLVPAFGRGTIRQFQRNVSELKKLAARNYEDILQVRPTQTCLPVFLIPLIVCHTCIWWTSPWTSQHTYSVSNMGLTDVACSHKAEDAYWVNTHPIWKGNTGCRLELTVRVC